MHFYNQKKKTFTSITITKTIKIAKSSTTTIDQKFAALSVTNRKKVDCKTFHEWCLLAYKILQRIWMRAWLSSYASSDFVYNFYYSIQRNCQFLFFFILLLIFFYHYFDGNHHVPRCLRFLLLHCCLVRRFRVKWVIEAYSRTPLNFF